MTKPFRALALLTVSAAVSGCTLAPHYERPGLPVAPTWSVPVQNRDAAPSASDQTANNTMPEPLKWHQLFIDPALQKTIELALANNRDLRVATLNVAKARAQYGIERAALFPDLTGSFSGVKSHPTGNASTYTASLGLSWELDLFGKAQSLKNAAKEDYFSQQETRNAAEIALIASVADSWITLASDQDVLKLDQQTYASYKETYDIATGQAKLGAISDLDLAQIRTEMEGARATLAKDATTLDQDKAALTLLVGADVPSDLLPEGLKDGIVADSVPVGLPSTVLLNRPDVLAAEHVLKADNANIGAARAAFFPSISLTGSEGSASDQLNDLFKSGNGKWSYGTGLSVPIFDAGANLNNLRSAKVTRDIAVAQYQKSIQTAFSDVNSALAVRARIDERLDAQSNSMQAAQTSLTLSQARYQAGSDSYLTLMTAQRTLYSAQSTLIALKALKASNLVGLYSAIGDDTSLQ